MDTTTERNAMATATSQARALIAPMHSCISREPAELDAAVDVGAQADLDPSASSPAAIFAASGSRSFVSFTHEETYTERKRWIVPARHSRT